MLLSDFDKRSTIQVIEEASSKNNYRPRVRGLFQRADEANQNKRVYPKTILETQVKKLQPLISERRLCGELDHPQNDTVKLTNASHLVTKLWMEGAEVFGEAEILNTPNGKVAQALINDGVKIGISSRGLGTLSEDTMTGTKTVNEDFNLVTFDLVADPSTRGAYPTIAESKILAEAKYERTLKEAVSERVFITMLKGRLDEAKFGEGVPKYSQRSSDTMAKAKERLEINKKVIQSQKAKKQEQEAGDEEARKRMADNEARKKAEVEAKHKDNPAYFGKGVAPKKKRTWSIDSEEQEARYEREASARAEGGPRSPKKGPKSTHPAEKQNIKGRREDPRKSPLSRREQEDQDAMNDSRDYILGRAMEILDERSGDSGDWYESGDREEVRRTAARHDALRKSYETAQNLTNQREVDRLNKMRDVDAKRKARAKISNPKPTNIFKKMKQKFLGKSKKVNEDLKQRVRDLLEDAEKGYPEKGIKGGTKAAKEMSQSERMTAHSKKSRARGLRKAAGATDDEIKGRVTKHKSGAKLRWTKKGYEKED